jgi:hypothetical protein
MTGMETRQAFIRVGGCSGVVQSVNRRTFDELRYVDTDHSDDAFTGQFSGSFVQSWDAVGDTKGNEVGTKTGVSAFTHDITVTSTPC